MRGKAGATGVDAPDDGITPAYAGKRSIHRALRAFHRDHPRVCGEKQTKTTFVAKFKGSPPRMRGKVPKCVHALPHLGITPAYAGKSGFVPSSYSSERDHPRVCGEKRLVSQRDTENEGSPPRMRGKAFFFVPPKFCAGITPAYAGKRTIKTNDEDVT